MPMRTKPRVYWLTAKTIPPIAMKRQPITEHNRGPNYAKEECVKGRKSEIKKKRKKRRKDIRPRGESPKAERRHYRC
jgi:hypothetical protein